MPRHGGGVAKPGRVIGERRKVRERRAVNVSIPVQQRRELELVEDNNHYGRRSGERYAVEHAGLVGGCQQPHDAGAEQQHRGDDDHRRTQKGGKHADRSESEVRPSHGDARESGQTDQEAAGPSGKRLECREDDRAKETADDRRGGALAPARTAKAAGKMNAQQ